MGATNTKILNTISSNFGGLTRRDSKKTESEGKVLFQARSNSLDSISTALSFGTTSQTCTPSRSSSLDNLYSQSSTQRQTKSCGKRYMLLDNESVASTIRESSGDEQEGVPHGRRENPQRMELFTSSLPVNLEHSLYKTGVARTDPQRVRQRDVDEFSDNFVTSDFAKRPRSLTETAQDSLPVSMKTRPKSVPTRSILKEKKTASLEETLTGLRANPVMLSRLLSDSPNITQAVLAKLSPEEWDEVIMFACASLGQSLQSSIRNLSHSSSNSKNLGVSTAGTADIDSTHKHVTINEQVSTSMYERGTTIAGTGGTVSPQSLNTQERPRQRKRRSRKERPNSLPPVYDNTEQQKEISLEENGPTVDHLYARARSHSHEGNYYHKCIREPTKEKTRGHKSDPHYPCSSHSRKRRTPKPRNPNAPVDVSLDDNCPGVARVRRFHRHSHHHSFCDHYVDRGAGMKDRSAKLFGEKNSVKQLTNDCKSSKVPVDSKDVFVTLDDMQTAASVFRQSAQIAERSLASSYPGHSHRKQRLTPKSKHRSIEDEEMEVIDSSLQTESNMFQGGTGEGWNELAFPKNSRSGRDSPATDMAVIGLDLNSPSMLEPIGAKKTYLNNNFPAGSQMYLHSHNHYHHIIHHSQP